MTKMDVLTAQRINSITHEADTLQEILDSGQCELSARLTITRRIEFLRSRAKALAS